MRSTTRMIPPGKIAMGLQKRAQRPQKEDAKNLSPLHQKPLMVYAKQRSSSAPTAQTLEVVLQRPPGRATMADASALDLGDPGQGPDIWSQAGNKL